MSDHACSRHDGMLLDLVHFVITASLLVTSLVHHEDAHCYGPPPAAVCSPVALAHPASR